MPHLSSTYPRDIPLIPTYGTAEIRREAILLAILKLMITIGSSRRNKRTDRTIESHYPETAFASYAGGYRSAGSARIQGMKRVAPDLDAFLLMTRPEGPKPDELSSLHFNDAHLAYLKYYGNGDD